MKIKLFSLIFFLITFTSNTLASTYWSNVKDGPVSVNEVVSKLDGKKIDPIEGVWFTDSMGTVAILRDKDPVLGNVFKMYIIEGHGSAAYFNQTWEATFIKTSTLDYKFFIRVWYLDSWSGKIKSMKTQTGKTYVIGNSFTTRYDSRSDKGKVMDGKYSRVWPQDINAYNKKFEPKKTTPTTKEKSTKKKKVYDPLAIDDRKSFKDYWWVLIILALGAFFLYTTTVKKPLRKFKKIKTIKKTEGRIAKYWAGQETLGFSFWGICFLLLGALYIPLIVLADAADNMSGFFLLIGVLYVVFFFVAAVVAYVGCWRSAGFYIKMKLKKKSSAFWGYATYVYLSLSVLRSVVAFFKEF